MNAPTRIFERADFSKPKPKFDWDDLDAVYAPTIPEDAIRIEDIMERFNVRERRAAMIASECVVRGLLKRVGRGWYVKV